jgi:hypothetical protein
MGPLAVVLVLVILGLMGVVAYGGYVIMKRRAAQMPPPVGLVPRAEAGCQSSPT